MHHGPSTPLPIASLAAVLLGLPLLAPPASAAERVCTATAKAARSACRSEAQDDYWITVGNAEDAARIISVTEVDESVPAADCSGNCLVIEEFTPVEPDALGYKYYAPGVGIMLETDPETGERVELVSFTQP